MSKLMVDYFYSMAIEQFSYWIYFITIFIIIIINYLYLIENLIIAIIIVTRIAIIT